MGEPVRHIPVVGEEPGGLGGRGPGLEHRGHIGCSNVYSRAHLAQTATGGDQARRVSDKNRQHAPRREHAVGCPQVLWPARRRPYVPGQYAHGAAHGGLRSALQVRQPRPTVIDAQLIPHLGGMQEVERRRRQLGITTRPSPCVGASPSPGGSHGDDPPQVAVVRAASRFPDGQDSDRCCPAAPGGFGDRRGRKETADLGPEIGTPGSIAAVGQVEARFAQSPVSGWARRRSPAAVKLDPAGVGHRSRAQSNRYTQDIVMTANDDLEDPITCGLPRPEDSRTR